MRIVRLDIEPYIIPPYRLHIPPYDTQAEDTGQAIVTGRIVLNRFETRVWRAWQRAGYVWVEHVMWRVGRLRCRWLGQHNVSCRGRTDHV